MPVPVIAAGAAAIAARLAAKKLAKEAAKKALAAKTAQIAKNSVVKKPARTASGPGLETRGVKLTKSQRSERAAELSFKKLEGRWEGEYLTRMTGLKGPKGITSQTTRGQGKRSLRKSAAINKEAKPIIKINSAKPTKGSSDNFVEVPVKDSKLGAKPGVFSPRSVAARKPTRKPVPNPKNPPKGTMVINSGSNRPTMLRKKAVPMKTPVVKKVPRKPAPPKKK